MNNTDESLLEQRRTVWEQYAAIWKAEGRETKLELMTECLAKDNHYQDPLAGPLDHEALADYMVEFHKMVPGGHFVTRRFYTYTDQSVAVWDMCDGEGNVLGDGVSVGIWDEEGRIAAERGFFAPPPFADQGAS